MAVGFALVVFLIIEFVYGMSINNLEAAFFPAVSWGFLSFIAAAIYQAKQAESLENPPPEPYRLRFPETFATVQEVLNDCFDPPDGWKVIPGRHDRGEGDLKAYLIIRDDSFRNNKLLVPQRVLNKRVNLDVNVKPAGPGCTVVRLNYRVDCPWFANRADLNNIIRHTQSEVSGALDDLEVEKHEDESTIRPYFYQVLELSPGASIQEIKAAHKKLVVKWHTDRLEHNEELKALAKEKLIEINQAYECLSDPAKMRKFMTWAARTGWKPGQGKGAATGTATGGGTAEKSTGGNGASSDAKKEQEEQARKTSQEQAHKHSLEGYAETRYNIQQAAQTAARQAATSLKEKASSPEATEFYNEVYCQCVAAAKVEAENGINRYKLPLGQAQQLYAHARQCGQDAAGAELQSYRGGGIGLGALATPFENTDQLKIFAIIAGVVLIFANADKLPQIWNGGGGTAEQADNHNGVIEPSKPQETQTQTPTTTFQKPSAMDPAEDQTPQTTTDSEPLPKTESVSDSVDALRRRLRDKGLSDIAQGTPALQHTEPEEPAPSKTLSVSWDDPDRDSKLESLNGFDTIEITGVPYSMKINVYRRGLIRYFTIAGLVDRDPKRYSLPFTAKSLSVNGRSYSLEDSSVDDLLRGAGSSGSN